MAIPTHAFMADGWLRLHAMLICCYVALATMDLAGVSVDVQDILDGTYTGYSADIYTCAHIDLLSSLPVLL